MRSCLESELVSLMSASKGHLRPSRHPLISPRLGSEPSTESSASIQVNEGATRVGAGVCGVVWSLGRLARPVKSVTIGVKPFGELQCWRVGLRKCGRIDRLLEPLHSGWYPARAGRHLSVSVATSRVFNNRFGLCDSGWASEAACLARG